MQVVKKVTFVTYDSVLLLFILSSLDLGGKPI